MNSPVTVRDATIEDAPLIARFNGLMAQETEGKQLDQDTALRGVHRAFEQPGAGRYFIAEVEGKVAGQALITYEWTDWRDGWFWWFQSVYVVPEFRRRGVFRTLYTHVRDLARRDSDVRGLRLYVEQENQRAMKTYEQLGMNPSGHVVYEEDWSVAE